MRREQRAWLKAQRLVQRRVPRLFAIETAEPERVCAQIKRELAWAAFADVRPIHKIPVDHRHNAKVDYTALAACRIYTDLLDRFRDYVSGKEDVVAEFSSHAPGTFSWAELQLQI